MSDVVVRRWKRYGHDRVYVSTTDGRRLGWRDLNTGNTVVEAPDHAVELIAALAGFAPAVPEPPAPADAPDGTTEPRPWRDLALTRPGRMSRLREAAKRAFGSGADHDETVGAKLEKLTGDGWRVLHSVPVGGRGSGIDHVLIGPGGVFTVSTKVHPGKQVWVSPRQIRVNGQPVPYLSNSRYEASRAERLLSRACRFSVLVKPALVFLTGSYFPNVTIRERPDDVLILDRTDIPDAFRRTGLRLQPDQVEAVFDMARRDITWV